MDTQSLSYEDAGADVDGHLPKQSAPRQNDETNHGHEADQLPDVIRRATHEQRRESRSVEHSRQCVLRYLSTYSHAKFKFAHRDLENISMALYRVVL